jgi:hypothetical protein
MGVRDRQTRSLLQNAAVRIWRTSPDSRQIATGGIDSPNVLLAGPKLLTASGFDVPDGP